MDVGGTLRNARLRKRLTLEQVSHSTKIGAATLEALENNDFERLPAAVYTRGFLRAVAREVDLDPEETVEQYMEQFDLTPPMAIATDVNPQTEAPTADGGASQRRAIVIPRLALQAVAAIIIVAIAGVYVYSSRRGQDPAVQTPSETSTATAPPPPAAPVSDVARAANVEPDALRIDLTATGPCWVSATADRESALSRLLQAGERQELHAKEEIVLRVGDPSTLTISINGVPGRPLGRPGLPVTVQINKQNFREFQSS